MWCPDSCWLKFYNSDFILIIEGKNWGVTQYTTQKAIEGSVLADHLAQQPLEDNKYQPIGFEFPDEDIMFIRDYVIPGPKEGPEPGSRWTLVFDGASNALGNGVGCVITSPTGFHIPFTARVNFDCKNNMAEYEACIYGVEAAICNTPILPVAFNNKNQS